MMGEQRKWAHSMGYSSHFESFSSSLSPPASPFLLPSIWMFCGVMGSKAGQRQWERPNWSVFSTAAKSCHHNKVGPWSCCEIRQQRYGWKYKRWLTHPSSFSSLPLTSFSWYYFSPCMSVAPPPLSPLYCTTLFDLLEIIKGTSVQPPNSF